MKLKWTGLVLALATILNSHSANAVEVLAPYNEKKAGTPGFMEYNFEARIDMPLSLEESRQCLNSELVGSGNPSHSLAYQNEIPGVFGIKFWKKREPLALEGNERLQYHLTEVEPERTIATVFRVSNPTPSSRAGLLREIMLLQKCASDTRHPNVKTNSYVVEPDAYAEVVEKSPTEAAVCIEQDLYNYRVMMGRNYTLLHVTIDNIGAGNGYFGWVIINDDGKTKIATEYLSALFKTKGSSKEKLEESMSRRLCLRR